MISALLILILIIANGVFALSEMSLVSAKKVKLEQQAAEGSKGAERALALMSSPNRFLSTVQIGITLIGVLAGAFGGSALSKPLAALMAKVSWLEPYAQPISFTLVVILITYFSLVIGELVPKRVALSNPERYASSTSGLMTMIAKVAQPLVKFLSLSMNILLRILGVNPNQVESITSEEITLLLEQATQAGLVEEAEQDIVENVFMLGDRRVNSVMTSRPEITWLNTEDSAEALEQQIRSHPHNRYLVADGDLGQLKGVVMIRDLMLTGFPQTIDWSIIKTPLFVPETMTPLVLLEEFRKSQQHMAVVIDEYGEVEGLITVTDLLESMVGDLPDSNEQNNSFIVKRDDNSWLMDGLVSMDEFKNTLKLAQLPEGSSVDYQTLGGFVVAKLERIPKPSEKVFWQNLSFEVVDMDGQRIDKILVARVKKKAEEKKD